MKKILASFVAVGLALFATGFYAARMAVEPTPSLRTARVKRGDLSRTLTVKGTIKLEQVEVGAQVTGMIRDFGCDPADPTKLLDCGAHVRSGMVLAQIDPTIYQAQVDCVEASLRKAKANLLQARAKYDEEEHEWKRAQSLRPAKAIADSDFDGAVAGFRMAAANVAVWEAAVQECEASLRIARTNLNYTTIRSPCDGVIIDRRVNIGQTVVAAFNAPGLFLIAKDSRQMQVWASVNEADIGLIHPGLPVQFTVSACLDRSFEGKVAQVRLNPTKRQDVMTYTVVVAADHLGNMLPDMTANLHFVVERHPNVLLIPNDALQGPPPTAADIQTTAPIDAFGPSADQNANPPTALSLARGAIKLWNEQKLNRRLWVKDGRLVHPIDVQVGASNGLMTEIMGNNVKEGMEVVCMTHGH
jgi:HlyD family secretion protein